MVVIPQWELKSLGTTPFPHKNDAKRTAGQNFHFTTLWHFFPSAEEFQANNLMRAPHLGLRRTSFLWSVVKAVECLYLVLRRGTGKVYSGYVMNMSRGGDCLSHRTNALPRKIFNPYLLFSDCWFDLIILDSTPFMISHSLFSLFSSCFSVLPSSRCSPPYLYLRGIVCLVPEVSNFLCSSDSKIVIKLKYQMVSWNHSCIYLFDVKVSDQR